MHVTELIAQFRNSYLRRHRLDLQHLQTLLQALSLMSLCTVVSVLTHSFCIPSISPTIFVSYRDSLSFSYHQIASNLRLWKSKSFLYSRKNSKLINDPSKIDAWGCNLSKKSIQFSISLTVIVLESWVNIVSNSLPHRHVPRIIKFNLHLIFVKSPILMACQGELFMQIAFSINLFIQFSDFREWYGYSQKLNHSPL